MRRRKHRRLSIEQLDCRRVLTAPTAFAFAPEIVDSSADQTITVTYLDDVAVDVASLGNDDIEVVSPLGKIVPARLAGKSTNSNATPITATYRIDGSAGQWDDVNGEYQIRLRESSVADANGTFANAGRLGSFTVNIEKASTELPTFRDYNVSVSTDGARSVFAGDLDGDGDVDIAATADGRPSLRWYRNDGNQGFDAISIANRNLREVIGDDVDDDGDTDLVAHDYNNGYIPLIRFYKNNGTGSFTETNFIWLDRYLSSWQVADLDNDGDTDLITTAYSSTANFSRVAWYRNNGDQSFTVFTVAASSGPQSITSMDVNNDGDMDLVVGFQDGLRWYENDGRENFTERNLATSSTRIYFLNATDINGDGLLDLFAARSSPSDITWYENQGNSSFTEHTVTDSIGSVNSLDTSDLDQDGDMDIVLASASDDKIAWYENDGDENFKEHVVTASADGAQDARVADIDQDGNLDIISASYNDDTIAWYENLSPDRGTPSVDTEAPTVVATASDINTSNFTSQVVTVSYTDNEALDVSSLGIDDIEVQQPDGTVTTDFQLFSTSAKAGDSTAQAFLTVEIPTTAPNGTYSIVLREDQVSDAAGNFASSGVIGTFNVNRSDVQPLEGDANGDLKVDFADFLILSMNFGEPGDKSKGDFTGDGFVSFTDFLLLSANFGKQI